MTFEEKKAWLRRYQEAKCRERLLTEEAQQLRAEAERVTPLMDDMPKGSAGQDKLQKAVERIIDAEQELAAQINCCEAIRREVVEAVNTVEDPRRYEILHRRYILGQRWEQIAVNMGIDYRWVWRLHKTTILKLTIKSDI